MKKNVIFAAISLALFCHTQTALSQGWRIAPVVGVNVSSISYSAGLRANLNLGGLTTKPGPLVQGHVGALIDYAFSDRFSIRSGLLYTGKGGSFKITSLSQYGGTESTQGRYTFSYVDIPLLMNFAIGHNNWRIMAGGTASLMMSVRGSVESGGSLSNYGYYKGTTTFSLGAYQVQSLDLSTTVGVFKELEVAGRPFEIGLYTQNSITKWNLSARTQPDLYARHNSVGFRLTYFFALRR